MTTHGHFHWNELMTRDPEAAKSFYSEIVGWTFEPWQMEAGTYWVCKSGDTPVAGIFDMNGPDFEGIPAHWFSYLHVDDIDVCVESAKAAGGELMRPLFDVPQVGRIAIVKDPTGAALGWIKPEPMP